MDNNVMYGLTDDQIITPMYVDCAAIGAAAEEWRRAVRGAIIEIRHLRTQLGQSRDLNERYVLNVELKNRYRQMAAALESYRATHRAILRVSREFLARRHDHK